MWMQCHLQHRQVCNLRNLPLLVSLRHLYNSRPRLGVSDGTLSNHPLSLDNNWTMILGLVRGYHSRYLSLVTTLGIIMCHRFDNQSLAPNPQCKRHGQNLHWLTPGERSFLCLNLPHKGLVV